MSLPQVLQARVGSTLPFVPAPVPWPAPLLEYHPFSFFRTSVFDHMLKLNAVVWLAGRVHCCKQRKNDVRAP